MTTATQAEMVERWSKRVRDSLGDLAQMAAVDELWDNDIAVLKEIAILLESLVEGGAEEIKRQLSS